MEEAGRVDAAVVSYGRALDLHDTPETRIKFARCVKNLESAHVDARLRALLIRAVDEAWTRPSDLAWAAIKVIRADPSIDACIERASRAWPRRLSRAELTDAEGAALRNDALLLSLLQSAPICDIALERLLTTVRATILEATSESIEVDSHAIAFYCAIARQCDLNEYVFDCSEPEGMRIRALREKITAALASGAAISELEIVALAGYVSLSELEESLRLLDRQWRAPVQALLNKQLAAAETERRLRETLDRLTTIDDAVSLDVQQQYEQNPYPRWTRVPIVAKSQSLNDYLRAQFPRGGFDPLPDDRAIDVLIAGCGTGQEAIEAARLFAGARILAVDLSAASLAYAKRKSADAGIDNVRYAQADILKLESLDKSFDVITSVGVLHHLADPLKGWRALLSRLKPGGLMRVGLYSETGRRDVVAARAFIAARRYAATPADIRRARQDLIADGAIRVASLRDFYTTSECRDLLFHVQEHRFNLMEIKQALAMLDVEFVGFLLEPHVLQNYQMRFPHDRSLTDLDAWCAFESQVPDTFTRMYRFWVQKPH